MATGLVILGGARTAMADRLILTPVRELRERTKRFGVASAWIGGGQGIAVLAENPDTK